MARYVKELIATTSSTHVLRNSPEDYVAHFAEAIARVHSPQQIAEVLRNKFGVYDGGNIAINVYCEHAAELSVQNHLTLRTSATEVTTEKQVNPPKDVDVFFKVHQTQVCLEVKCPVEPDESPGVVLLRTAGRVPDHLAKANELGDLLKSGDNSVSVSLAKNKDNALKDFLLSSHGKFSPDCGIDDLNVLFVACGNGSSLQSWHTYLVGHQGLFTTDAFYLPSEFNLVDVVVISNLKNCHLNGRNTHRFTLDDVFLLPVLNPFHRTTLLSSSIINGLSVFDHHLQRFGQFVPAHAPDVPDYIFNS